MALLWTDSFDHYATADIASKWTQIIVPSFAIAPVIGATGRHGSNGIRWPGVSGGGYGGSSISKLVQPSGAKAIVGFAFANTVGPFANLTVNANCVPTGYDQSNYLTAIRQGGTVQVWLRINSTGTITALRGGSASTELGTTTRALAVGSYAYIEFKVLIDPAVGTVDIHVNGESWLALTAQNTRNTANATWDEVLIGGLRVTNTVATWDYDDVYLLDGTGALPWNDFLGDVRVDYHVPNAVGSNNGSMPSVGTDRSFNVDDPLPNGDVDFNVLVTTGNKDTYNLEALKSTGSAILGMQVLLMVKKADTGVGQICPVVRHAGVDYDGTVSYPGTIYQYFTQMYAVNPGTGAQLTETEFNALEVGIKRIA